MLHRWAFTKLLLSCGFRKWASYTMQYFRRCPWNQDEDVSAPPRVLHVLQQAEVDGVGLPAFPALLRSFPEAAAELPQRRATPGSCAHPCGPRMHRPCPGLPVMADKTCVIFMTSSADYFTFASCHLSMWCSAPVFFPILISSAQADNLNARHSWPKYALLYAQQWTGVHRCMHFSSRRHDRVKRVGREDDYLFCTPAIGSFSWLEACGASGDSLREGTPANECLLAWLSPGARSGACCCSAESSNIADSGTRSLPLPSPSPVAFPSDA